MEIATGYFAKAITYSKDGWALVSIALKDPWFLPKDLMISSAKELAPTPAVLDIKEHPAEYETKYLSEILSKVNWCQLYTRLYSIAKAENKNKVVLLCYESPEKFCHRHIVAEWFWQKSGIAVKEIAETRKPVPSLFDIFDSDSLA